LFTKGEESFDATTPHRQAPREGGHHAGDSMKFEVYCDENHPELFTSKKPTATYLMIGSLWLPAGLRPELKEKVRQLREIHNTWGEIKWRKISPARLDFYKGLVD